MDLDTANPIPKTIQALLEQARLARYGQDFSRARRLYRAVVRILLRRSDGKLYLPGILALWAETYGQEMRYTDAEAFYRRALAVAVSVSAESMQVAYLLVRQSELLVLQGRLDDYERSFENARRAYVLAKTGDPEPLLTALNDLAWTLCIRRLPADAREVNQFVAQVKDAEFASDSCGGLEDARRNCSNE